MAKTKRRKKIALICGGAGAEHDVSLLGAKNVEGLIDSQKYIILRVKIQKNGEWVIVDEKGERPTYPVMLEGKRGFLDGEKIVSVHCAFPLLHGDFGEDGRVQGALECAGIPYVGCAVTAGAVTSDKIYTKIIAESIGIPTVRWIARQEKRHAPDIASAMEEAESRIGYPMFIKPSGLGSSVGASACLCRDEFASAYAEAANRGDGRVLIEEFISERRELECACLITDGKTLLTPPGEISVRGCYSFEEKYSQNSHASLTITAEISPQIHRLIHKYSGLLAEALGLRDIARIDFFLENGKLYFNEINTMPGFTEGSLYVRLIEKAGISPTELFSRLIDEAARRG